MLNIKNYFIYVFVICFCNFTLPAQQSSSPNKKKLKADSLKLLIKSAKHDSTRFNNLVKLGILMRGFSPDTAFYYHLQAKKIAGKLNDKLLNLDAINQLAWDHFLLGDYDSTEVLYHYVITNADNYLNERNLSPNNIKRITVFKITATIGTGSIYDQKGETGKALEEFFKAVKLCEQRNVKPQMASALNNIGLVYDYQGDHSKALEYYFKSLKINQESGNKYLSASNFGNIGSVYFAQRNYEKALEYYQEAFLIHSEGGNKRGMAIILCNMGNSYRHQKNNSKALEYYFKAQKLDEEIGNKAGQSYNLCNIGVTFMNRADSAYAKGNMKLARVNHQHALYYNFKADTIDIKLDNKKGRSANLGNIGAIYVVLNQYKKAEEYIQRAFLLATELNSLQDLKQIHDKLFKLYDATGKPALALKHYKLSIQYLDSVNNEESIRNSIQQEYKFNYEKKFAADSVTHAKEKEIKEAEIAQHLAEIKVKRNQQYALFGGLALVLIFSGFTYDRFKVARKQKGIIEEQKKITDEKQKEILDSIYYARRIQRSLLTSDRYFDKNLKRLQKP